jgi:hypothetical protein
MSPDPGDPERVQLLKLAQGTIDQLASEPEQNTGLYRWALERLELFLSKRLTRRVAALASQVGALQKLEDKLVVSHAIPSTMHGTLDVQQLDTVPADLLEGEAPPSNSPTQAKDWLSRLQTGRLGAHVPARPLGAGAIAVAGGTPRDLALWRRRVRCHLGRAPRALLTMQGKGLAQVAAAAQRGGRRRAACARTGGSRNGPLRFKAACSAEQAPDLRHHQVRRSCTIQCDASGHAAPGTGPAPSAPAPAAALAAARRRARPTAPWWARARCTASSGSTSVCTGSAGPAGGRSGEAR